jgi:preprotein translocase subunit YajC
MSLFAMQEKAAQPVTSTSSPAEPGAPGGQAGQSDPGILGNPMFMIVAMFAIMYMLIIRPQSKRQKQAQNLLDALKVNDKVVTNGGIKGVVTRLNGDEITLEIAKGTHVVFTRSAITSLQSQAQVENKKAA